MTRIPRVSSTRTISWETLSENVRAPAYFSWSRFTCLTLLHYSTAAAILFALALLASGQSSSIIATLAGQIVSEGFIRWKLSVRLPRRASPCHARPLTSHLQPVMRRLVTRCIGLVPSLAVAAAVGRSGIDTLLVASQVILSIVLPFIVFPLVYLTSSRSIMSVRKPKKLRPEDADVDELPAGAVTPAESDEKDKETTRVDDTDAEAQAGEMVDFSNGYIVTGLGYLIWLVVVVANVYAIVGLALGDD